MSIQQNFPAISPSLSLNFARSKTLDPRITFTRTSSGTRTNSQGLVEVVSANTPRFDHSYDPVSGTVRSLGLLVEEQRTTYQTYTEDPTQWNTSNMVPTGNSVTLPTGEVSTTIEYKGETTDANNKFIRPTTFGTITAGDTFVYSGFYKKGTTNGERYVHIVLQNNTASEGTGRRFDFDNGDWASTQSLNGVTVANSGFEKYPNGWFRIWMSCTFPSDSGAVQTFTRLFINSTSIPYDTSFSLWGAQLEKGSFPTSYIPNDTGSQKTRNPDNVSMTGDNFSSWYNQSEGTFFARHKVGVGRTSGGSHVYSADLNFSNRISAQYAFNGEENLNRFRSFVRYTGTVFGDFSPDDSAIEGVFQKSSHSYSLTNTTQYLNGSIVGVGTTPTGLPITTTFEIGKYMQTFDYLNGHISQLIYYPRRLTNTQLQNLTR